MCAVVVAVDAILPLFGEFCTLTAHSFSTPYLCLRRTIVLPSLMVIDDRGMFTSGDAAEKWNKGRKIRQIRRRAKRKTDCTDGKIIIYIIINNNNKALEETENLRASYETSVMMRMIDD